MVGDGSRDDRWVRCADGWDIASPARRNVNAMLVQRLGEADLDEEEGRIGFLNLMARAGIYVSEGVVLTRECHRRFLETAGLDRAIKDSGGANRDVRRRVRALRRGYERGPVDSALNRVICEAIIGLGARTVAVVSGDVTRAGLRSVPEARDAVLKAWLSVNGLKRQIQAASRGEELPTWPVLIQREVHHDPGMDSPA